MAEVYCGSEPCPLFLNSTCVFYTGESLLYIGVQTNDTLEAIIVKINQAFQNTGIGYAFTNGVIQPTPSQPVQLGGALIQNTTIGGNFTLTFSGNVQAAKHITTGGSSSQFVKGDGTLDSTAYQPAANYITGLSGDVLASGPGVAAATLATVNFSSGTFGNGNTIPIVTVNSKGLVTNITPTPINLPPISLTFIGDVVGSGLTGSNITLLLQNVNPNPYNTITPLKFSVNGKGLVTSASPITASDIVNILGFNPSGTAGSSGTSGTTGTSGTSGTSGIDGTFGTSGTSGTSGSSATSGTSGTSGSSGTAGTSGSTGTSGSSGTTGTSGSSGTTGTSGSSGTSGTTGTSGSSGTSGTTGTSGSSGLSGDRFKTTSTTTYTLQAPGNPGTLTVDPGLSYTVAQSIIIAYDANNHNEAEVTSYNSITGVINFVTFTLTGSGTYSNWFVNIDGASGGDGSSGSSGTTGTSGSSGTSGTTGTSGSSGTSGTTGTSGSSGTSGTSATDGTGGTSGTSGSSATSGTSGTSGTSATSGTSGTSGSTPVNQITGSGTSGQVAYFTGTTTITGENNLFWDSTNDRLGIGLNNPAAELQVGKSSDVTIAMSNSSSVTSGIRGGIAWYNSSVSTVANIRAVAVTDNVGTGLEFYTRPVAGSLTKTFDIASTGAATFSSTITTTGANINGDVLITNSSNAQIGFNTTGALNSAGAYLYFNRSGSNKWTAGMGPYTGSDNYEIATGSVVALSLAVTTGAAIFSSTVRINADGQSLLIFPTTTNSVRMQIQSTGGGNLVLGTENSTGGNLATGTNAYASVFSSGSTRDLVLGTNSIARLTINGTSGNVLINSNMGIGTGFTPAYPLHVFTSVADWGAVVQNLNASSYGMYVRGGATNGSTSAFFVANTASATLFDIKGSGVAIFHNTVSVNSNVDIVNYTTGSSLFVGGAATNGVSNGIILLQSGRVPQSGSDTTGTNGLLFQHTISNATNVNGGYIYNGRETVFSSASQVNTFISFATTLANTNYERMRITSDGILKMSNNSTTFSIGAIGGVQRIQHGTNGFTTEFQFFGAYDGYAPIGASAFNTRSDYRLKEDLKEFSGLSLVTDMKVYDFKWKEQDERNYGFMAHELQEILPYVVTGTKDGMFEGELQMQGVDYSKLVPILVKAIQELQAKLDKNNIN